MKKTGVKALVKGVRMAASKHSPAILTGIGVALGVTATVLAVKATPKAMQLLEEKKEAEEVDELTPVEVVKTAWKPYIPVAITTVASAACVIGAHSVHMKRTAALAAAYKISETALSEYSSKVLETVGEKKEQTIREKVAQERIDKKPVGNREVIVTGDGDTLCYDYYSDRYFYSDVNKLRKAENKLNKQILHDIGGSVSLNEFYDEINLKRTPDGDKFGWNTDDLIDLDIHAGLSDNDKPCIVVAHYVGPKYDYC